MTFKVKDGNIGKNNNHWIYGLPEGAEGGDPVQFL